MTTIKEQKELGRVGADLRNHVVVIGWNEFGQSVTRHLVAAGRPTAVITNVRENIRIIRELYPIENVLTLYSDYNNFDLFEKIKMIQATIVFINLDTEKLVYLINIRKRFKTLKLCGDPRQWKFEKHFSNCRSYLCDFKK